MTTKVLDYSYKNGDQFAVDSTIYTIVGFYNGSKNYQEMFTKTFVDNELTQYQRWNCGYEMPWELQDDSTLTELDLVNDHFHHLKRLDF